MGIFDLARQVGRLQGQKQRRDTAIENALSIGRGADAARAARRQDEREDKRSQQKSVLDILKQKREDARREEDVEERIRDNDRQERQMKQSQEQYEQTQSNINRRHEESLDAQKERKYTVEMSKGAKEVSDRAFDAAKDSSRDLNKYAKAQASAAEKGAKEVSDRAIDAAKDSARDLNKYRREQRESATEVTTRAVDAPRDVLERAKSQAKGVKEVGDRAVSAGKYTADRSKDQGQKHKKDIRTRWKASKDFDKWIEDFEFDNDRPATDEEKSEKWRQLHEQEKNESAMGAGGSGGPGQDRPFRVVPGQETPVAFDYPGSQPINRDLEFEHQRQRELEDAKNDARQIAEYSAYPEDKLEQFLSYADKGQIEQFIEERRAELASGESGLNVLSGLPVTRLGSLGKELGAQAATTIAGGIGAEAGAAVGGTPGALLGGLIGGNLPQVRPGVLNQVGRAKEIIAEGKQGLKGLEFKAPDLELSKLPDWEIQKLWDDLNPDGDIHPFNQKMLTNDEVDEGIRSGILNEMGLSKEEVFKKEILEELERRGLGGTSEPMPDKPKMYIKKTDGTEYSNYPLAPIDSDEMILARNAMEGPGSPTYKQLHPEIPGQAELREAIDTEVSAQQLEKITKVFPEDEEAVELLKQAYRKQEKLDKENFNLLREEGDLANTKQQDIDIDMPVDELIPTQRELTEAQDILKRQSRFQLGAVGNLGEVGKVPGGVTTETKNFIGKVREFVADSNVPGDPAQFAADMIKKNPEAPFLGGQDAKIVFGPFDPRSVALLFPKIANMAQPQVLKMLRSLDAELTKIDGIIGGLKPGSNDSLALGKWLVGKTDQLPDHLRGFGDAIRGKMNELLLRYKYGHAAIPQPTTRVEYPTGGSQTKLVEDILGPGKKIETVTRDVPLRTTREVETTYPAGGKQGSLFPDILGPEFKLEPSQLTKQQQLDDVFDRFSEAISTGNIDEIRRLQQELIRVHGTNPEELVNFATHGDQKKLFDDLLGNLTKKETIEGTEVLKKVEQVESNYPTGVLEQMRLVADKLGPKVKTEAPTPLRKFIEVTSDFSERLSTNDDAVEIIESLTRLVSRKEHLGQTLKDIKAEIKKMAPGPDATRREKIIHDMQKWYLDSYVNALGGKPNALISPTRIVDSFLELFGAKPNSASRFFIAGKMMASRSVLGLRVASAQTNALIGALNAASQGKLAKGLNRWWAEGGKTLSGETLKEMGYTSPIFPRRLGKIRDMSFLGLVDKDTGKAIDKVLYGPLNAGTSATAGARYWSAVEEFMEKAPKGLTKDTIIKRAHEFGLIEAQKVQNLGAHGFEAPIYDDPIISAALQFTRPMWDQFDVAVRQNLVKAAKGNREPLLKFLAYTGGVIGLVGLSGYGDTKEAIAKLYDFLMPWKGPARTQTFGPMTQGFDAAQQFIQNLAGDVTRKEAYKGSAEAVFSNLAPAGKQINEAREQFIPTEEEAKQEKTLAAGTKRTAPGTGERFKRAFSMFRTPQEEAEERLKDASNIKDDVLRKMRIKQRRKEINKLGVKTKP